MEYPIGSDRAVRTGAFSTKSTRRRPIDSRRTKRNESVMPAPHASTRSSLRDRWNAAARSIGSIRLKSSRVVGLAVA